MKKFNLILTLALASLLATMGHAQSVSWYDASNNPITSFKPNTWVTVRVTGIPKNTSVELRGIYQLFPAGPYSSKGSGAPTNWTAKFLTDGTTPPYEIVCYSVMLWRGASNPYPLSSLWRKS